MKQLTDSQLINLLSIALGITVALFGVMVYYFRNEVQFLVECLNQSFKREQEIVTEWYEKCKEANQDNLRLIKEKQELNDLYEKTFNIYISKTNLKSERFLLHNKKYSTICRILYDENKTLQEKIAELESKKLKERKKR